MFSIFFNINIIKLFNHNNNNNNNNNNNDMVSVLQIAVDCKPYGIGVINKQRIIIIINFYILLNELRKLIKYDINIIL